MIFLIHVPAQPHRSVPQTFDTRASRDSPTLVTEHRFPNTHQACIGTVN